MPVFTYKATAPAAGEMTGNIAADTPRQARDLLRERGLLVRDLAPYGAAGPARRSIRVRRHEVTSFIRELSTLLAVGSPLLEALDVISRQPRGKLHGVLLVLRDQVSSGRDLAGAMADHPRAFDALCVNITEVGENAGTLDSSLERLADFRERSDQLRGKVGTALIYPCIVLAMATVASLFLMTYVVPGIIQPLIEQGRPLPFPTRVVKGLSDFLLTWWPLLLVLVGASIGGIVAIVRTNQGRHRLHRLMLRLPLFGELVRKQATVKVAVVLSTLLKSGIVLLRALQIAQQTTTNLVLREALAKCEVSLGAGGDVADALARTDAFPPAVVQVFSLGQQSGKLEEMLDRIATAYDQEVASAAQRLTAVLEPVLIVLLALLVLFIVLATLLPILEAGHAVL